MNGTYIHEELSLHGYTDDFLIQLCEREFDEKFILQEQQSKQSKIYNNETLRNKIYESFLKYPLRKVPIKDRPGVLLSKMIGIIRRKSLEKNTKLLEGKISSSYDEHTHFVSEIANLESYMGNTTITQNTNTNVIRKDGNSIENSR